MTSHRGRPRIRSAAANHTAKTRKAYPWRFSFQLTYRLVEGAVQVISYVNCDGPWSLGFHPFFRLPLAGPPDDRSRCTARLPVTKIWELEHLVPTGRILPLRDDLPLARGARLSDLVCDQLFTGVEADLDGRYAMTYFDSRAKLGVSMECDAKIFPEAIIYCPKDDPFICIEPWTSPPNALNSGWGLVAGGTSIKTAVTLRPVFKLPARVKRP